MNNVTRLILEHQICTIEGFSEYLAQEEMDEAAKAVILAAYVEVLRWLRNSLKGNSNGQ